MIISVTATWFRFLVKQLDTASNQALPPYIWYEMSFFLGNSSNGSTALFCFDIPANLKSSVIAALDQSSNVGSRTTLIWLENLIIEQAVYLYDQSVWNIRDWIRNVELVRSFMRMSYRSKFH
jgi:hypothetical protein